MGNAKGMRALHQDDTPRREPSASDGVVAALREILAEEPGFPTGGALSAEQIADMEVVDGLPLTAAEQSKPIDREPSPAPSLYVPGMEAIKQAGAATEADRVREYGLLAEIDAKLSANTESRAQLRAVIEATEATLERANKNMDVASDEEAELEKQRAETVDRIVKLNQAAIDHETARLRRGQ